MRKIMKIGREKGDERKVERGKGKRVREEK